MNDRTHEAWTLRLSDYLNGDLAPDESESVERHLETCASCRGVLNDLRDVVARARGLGELQPPRDLWPGIVRGMQTSAPPSEGARVIAFPGVGDRRSRRGLWMTLPQVAAASVVLVAVSAAATWWAGLGLAGEARPADGAAPAAAVSLVDDRGEPTPELAEELAALEAVLAQARERLDPNTARILEKNLGVIQLAIDECRQALAVDPANPFLREHLQRTYRDKADFLREVTAIADWEG